MRAVRLAALLILGTAILAPRLPATIDNNHDGISDIWTGLSPTAGLPSADPDGDGATNLAEALAGTAPAPSASSMSAVLQLDETGNLRLRWSGVNDKRYLVESSPELATWSTLPGTLNGTGAALSSIVRAAGVSTETRRFWRVGVADTDSDGLNDWEEAQLGTSPTAPDTDHDGLPDGAEVANGSAPKVAAIPHGSQLNATNSGVPAGHTLTDVAATIDVTESWIATHYGGSRIPQNRHFRSGARLVVAVNGFTIQFCKFSGKSGFTNDANHSCLPLGTDIQILDCEFDGNHENVGG